MNPIERFIAANSQNRFEIDLQSGIVREWIYKEQLIALKIEASRLRDELAAERAANKILRDALESTIATLKGV